MKPTNKLRFVERKMLGFENGVGVSQTFRVLQQWWEETAFAHDREIVVNSEWRDVPVEAE
jgi:hypothetical protein